MPGGGHMIVDMMFRQSEGSLLLPWEVSVFISGAGPRA